MQSVNFIQIGDERIRKNTIKRYKPIGETKINIHYNSSATNPDKAVIQFENRAARFDALENMDNLL